MKTSKPLDSPAVCYEVVNRWFLLLSKPSYLYYFNLFFEILFNNGIYDEKLSLIVDVTMLSKYLFVYVCMFCKKT